MSHGAWHGYSNESGEGKVKMRVQDRNMVCQLPQVVMKKIKMSGGLIRHHLCCLECGLIGEGEAVVADEGGDGEGENVMGKLIRH